MIALSLLPVLFGAISKGVLATETVHVTAGYLKYTGAWVAGSTEECGYDYRTTTLGSTVSYTFTGVGWKMYLGSGNSSGSSSVTDGSASTFPIESLGSSVQSCTAGYNAGGLPYGEYTVTVTHQSSDGSDTSVLGFDYTALTDAEIAALHPISVITTGAVASSTPFASVASGSTSHGLSAGGIVGIVVGVVALFLAVLGLLFLRYRARVQAQLAASRQQTSMNVDKNAVTMIDFMPALTSKKGYASSVASDTRSEETDATHVKTPPAYQV